MTVLQSIDRYYGRMAARGEASLPGYSREKIDFVVILSEEGAPVAVNTLRRTEGRRQFPQQMDVPAAVIRKANIKPNLLWDKTAYSLGRTAGEGRRTAEEHAAFKAVNIALFGASNDAGLVAFRRFLETWSPEAFDAPPFAAAMLDANIVFALSGEVGYLHEREAAQHLIASQAGSGAAAQFCLVTGIRSPPARLHPSIRGVQGAQTAGASLVSFNLDAFTSYGKAQGDNAPTSEAAAFRYGTALNRMLDRDGRNRVRRTVGDATIVFWADTSDAVDEAAAATAEDVFAFMAEPATDSAEARRVADALKAVAGGRPFPFRELGLVAGTRFHVLGLSPNAARLSVRYWLSDSFDSFARCLAAHFDALALDPSPWRDQPPSVGRMLVQTTALLEKFENIPPSLAGEVMRSVLSGAPYPRTWLAATIMRLRAGDDPRKGWHAAAIKACVARMTKEETPPVSLDPEYPNTAYQLGRLFAVLEAAQYAALGRVNASIADRFYGAASATPARVFGTLLRGARTHVADAQKRNQGFWITPRLEQIIGHLPPELPKTLRLEDQGRFAVGYYHERAFRPAKPAPENEQQNEQETEQEMPQ
jgi:CRISPR-associated protein Csd1